MTHTSNQSCVQRVGFPSSISTFQRQKASNLRMWTDYLQKQAAMSPHQWMLKLSDDSRPLQMQIIQKDRKYPIWRQP